MSCQSHDMMLKFPRIHKIWFADSKQNLTLIFRVDSFNLSFKFNFPKIHNILAIGRTDHQTNIGQLLGSGQHNTRIFGENYYSNHKAILQVLSITIQKLKVTLKIFKLLNFKKFIPEDAIPRLHLFYLKESKNNN